MKKSLLLFLFSVSCILTLKAQEEREEPQPPTANASNVYAEFGGAGVIYSINYDGRFGKTDRGLGFRIGAGGFYADGEGYYMIPVGLNYLIGSNGKYFELGGGAAFGNFNEAFSADPDLNKSKVVGHLVFAFRKQAFRHRGVIFRAGFTPIFSSTFFIPSACVAIGFRF